MDQIEDQFSGLLIALDRDDGVGLRVQIERRLRESIRGGRLHPGTRLPASRSLARSLGVSRGVVVDAYEQLTAEGWLTAQQGSGTVVASRGGAAAESSVEAEEPRAPRWAFDMGVPDLTAFPRAAWARSERTVWRTLADARLGHPDPRGTPELRRALAAYLGRVRGVATTDAQLLITTGFWQGLSLVARMLARRGVEAMAVEDPGFALHRFAIRRAGLETVGIPVDERGIVVDRLERSGAGAVLVTPAHQQPTGVLLAPERRTALVEWAERRGALIIEDDYDGEYRYDRMPVGALHGLAPDHVIYGGTAGKTLFPALRLGWLAVPARLVDDLAAEKAAADGASPVLPQLTLADFLERGEYDRHLRRMRREYRRRRDRIVAVLAERVPEASVRGISAGLHVAVELPPGASEEAVIAAAAERGVRLEGLGPHAIARGVVPPTVLIGYGNLSLGALEAGLTELSRAIRSATLENSLCPS